MSQAQVIRDAAYNILTGVGSPFAGFTTKRKVSLPPVEQQDLPALSCFILDQESTPFGDSNIGNIKFYTDAVISFSVSRAFGDDPSLLEPQIVTDVENIKNLLLTNATFTRRWKDQSLFESVEKIDLKWEFPDQAEAYFVTCHVRITFRYQEWFEVPVTDLLKTIHVTTQFPKGGDPASTQQVVTEYDLPTE